MVWQVAFITYATTFATADTIKRQTPAMICFGGKLPVLLLFLLLFLLEVNAAQMAKFYVKFSGLSAANDWQRLENRQ